MRRKRKKEYVLTFIKERPYDDLPLLPPTGTEFETVPVYKKLSQARASLAELKGRLPIIPNPYMLINTLVLQEAKDSSEIENIFTSNDKMYRAFSSSKTKGDDVSTKEVVRYREALWDAFNYIQSTKNWDKQFIIKIFQTITQKEEAVRQSQVYIGNGFNVVYTPPSPSHIEGKLTNLIEFIRNEDEIDPLIKMAIMHYQFETIHPFSDGNGRTGRILNVLYLTYKSLLELPVLYISKYILEYKSQYYHLLRQVTEKNEWEPWILYILEAVNQTSIFSLRKINEIYKLFLETAKEVKTKAPEVYSHELLEVLFSQPYCKIKMLVDNGIASRNTASKYLNKLQEIGILEFSKEGPEALYLNKKLIKQPFFL
jgi:Fic family protein